MIVTLILIAGSLNSSKSFVSTVNAVLNRHQSYSLAELHSNQHNIVSCPAHFSTKYTPYLNVTPCFHNSWLHLMDSDVRPNTQAELNQQL